MAAYRLFSSIIFLTLIISFSITIIGVPTFYITRCFQYKYVYASFFFFLFSFWMKEMVKMVKEEKRERKEREERKKVAVWSLVL